MHKGSRGAEYRIDSSFQPRTPHLRVALNMQRAASLPHWAIRTLMDNGYQIKKPRAEMLSGKYKESDQGCENERGYCPAISFQARYNMPWFDVKKAYKPQEKIFVSNRHPHFPERS